MPSTRTSHPITSHEAEASVTNVQVVRQIILDMLAIEPATDTFLQEAYNKFRLQYGWPKIAESSIRARRSELVSMGLVEPSGKYEILESGRRSIVWKLAGDDNE